MNQEKIHLRQYSSTSGHLTPTSPRHEDTRLDPSLHVTPEGSLSDLPTAISTEEARERGCQMPEEKTQGTPYARLQSRRPLTLV